MRHKNSGIKIMVLTSTISLRFPYSGKIQIDQSQTFRKHFLDIYYVCQFCFILKGNWHFFYQKK